MIKVSLRKFQLQVTISSNFHWRFIHKCSLCIWNFMQIICLGSMLCIYENNQPTVEKLLLNTFKWFCLAERCFTVKLWILNHNFKGWLSKLCNHKTSYLAFLQNKSFTKFVNIWQTLCTVYHNHLTSVGKNSMKYEITIKVIVKVNVAVAKLLNKPLRYRIYNSSIGMP